jgi:hypothetical protein
MIHLVAFLDAHVIRADPPFSLIYVKAANRFSLLSDHKFKSDRKSSPDNAVAAASTSIFLAAAPQRVRMAREGDAKLANALRAQVTSSAKQMRR